MRTGTYPFDSGVRGFLQRVNALMGLTPYALPALAARVFPAAVFWQSGQTKVDGFAIAPATFYLFENDFRLPFIAPVPAAYLTTVAEHVFPVLLVLGLLTRLSALALLLMTLVIEVFVFPDAWVTHGLWAACFLVLIARGPGALSLDHLLGLDRPLDNGRDAL
jgi:putative oxidoreductase